MHHKKVFLLFSRFLAIFFLKRSYKKYKTPKPNFLHNRFFIYIFFLVETLWPSILLKHILFKDPRKEWKHQNQVFYEMLFYLISVFKWRRLNHHLHSKMYYSTRIIFCGHAFKHKPFFFNNRYNYFIKYNKSNRQGKVCMKIRNFCGNVKQNGI